MLLNIQLPFIPGDVDSVDWSKDGELAIAAGENIQLLLPNYGPGSLGQNRSDPSKKEIAPERLDQTREGSDAQWDSLLFRANSFTEEEIPAVAPASFQIFSLGEEQGVGAVSSIKWSSPGIGHQRRAVLAVLTANHLLSIWDGAPRLKKSEHFNRVMILNDYVLDHFGRDERRRNLPKDLQNLNQLRKRVMSFSWSHPCVLRARGLANATEDIWGTSFISVSNDNNELVIIRILPPKSPLVGKEWGAETLADVRAQQLNDDARGFSLLRSSMQAKPYISHMAWSPWVSSSDTEVAILAYISGELLSLKKVSASSQDEHGGKVKLDISTSEFSYQPRDQYVTKNIGPITWYDKTHNGYYYLVASFGHLLTIISIPAGTGAFNGGSETGGRIENIPGMSVSTYHILKYSNQELSGQRTLQPCWDEVSGLAVQMDSVTQDLIISFSTHLGHTESIRHVTTTALSEQINTSVQPLPKAPWQRRIADCQAQFDLHYDLGGLAIVKVWGLASSPGEDSITALVSTHPGDMVEYGIASSEKSTAIFGSWEEMLQRPFLQSISPNIAPLNCTEYSAEAFALQASRQLELHGVQSVGPQSSFTYNVNEAKQYLDQLSRNSTEAEAAVIIPNSSPQVMRRAISRRLLYSHAITAQRYANLLNITASWVRDRYQKQSRSEPVVPSSTLHDDAQAQAILYELVSTILSVPTFVLFADGASSKLLYNTACAGIYSCRYTNSHLVKLCEDAFQRLSSTHSVNLDYELSQCNRLQQAAGGMHPDAHTRDSLQGLDPELYRGNISSKGRKIDDAVLKQSPAAKNVFDTCDMCGKGIPWESLNHGRCGSGHIFVRCALTLLTIQAPGISKSCNICHKRYLSDEYITRSAGTQSHSSTAATGTRTTPQVIFDPELGPTDSTSPTNGHQPSGQDQGDTTCLIKLLHSSCDLCVYCGGKFIN